MDRNHSRTMLDNIAILKNKILNLGCVTPGQKSNMSPIVFYLLQIEKYQNYLILWQIVAKIRPGAQFLTRGHAAKT